MRRPEVEQRDDGQTEAECRQCTAYVRQNSQRFIVYFGGSAVLLKLR